MINLFDSANFQEGVPKSLIQGSYAGWVDTEITTTYPPALYTLKYVFNARVGPYSSEIVTAAKVSDAHQVTMDGSVTKTMPVGEHAWQAIVVRDADSAEIAVKSGLLDLKASLAGSEDTRTWAEQVLDNIRETIKGTASDKVASFTIGNRSLVSRSMAELLALEKDFSDRVKKEKQSAGSPKKRVLVGMGA